MRKVILLCSFGLLGSFAMASNGIELNKQNSSIEIGTSVSVCNTQSTTDCDGDTISVTCCRATYEDAYNCAAAKLKAAAFAAC